MQSDEDLFVSYVNEASSSAFRELYSRHEQRLFKLIRHRLARYGKEVSEEIFQKTWLKAHEARRSFDPALKFKPWITTIALNNIRDYVGEKWVRSVDSEAVEIDRQSADPSPEDTVISKAELESLSGVWKNLSQDAQTVLSLHLFYEMDWNEIAEETKLSPANVRKIASRSRKLLKDAHEGKEGA